MLKMKIVILNGCRYFLPVLCLVLISDLSAKKIQGIVLDYNTNKPVPEVFITLMNSSKFIKSARISDSLGYYAFNDVQMDTFYIGTRRMGYVNIESGPFVIANRESMDIIIKLEEQTFMLGEVLVEGEKVDRELAENGFYRRSETGNGKFFTREDFKGRSLHSVFDIFRSVSGIAVRTNTFGEEYIKSLRSTGLTGIRRSGGMLIYLDGIILDQDEMSFLNVINPENIKAVEIYSSGAFAPYQYSKGSNAGVILIWTGY